MTKGELRAIIREVLKEEIVTKDAILKNAKPNNGIGTNKYYYAVEITEGLYGGNAGDIIFSSKRSGKYFSEFSDVETLLKTHKSKGSYTIILIRESDIEAYSTSTNMQDFRSKIKN
jgi:hypothetical protein